MRTCHVLLALVAALGPAAPVAAADIPALVGALRGADEDAKRAAEAALIEAGPEAVKPLMGLVGDPDARPSQSAREVLHSLALAWASTEARRAAVCRPLMDVAAAPGGQATRELALDLLGMAGDARVVPEIAHLLHDPQVAPVACRALQHIPGTEAVAALTVALGWAKSDLQVHLLHALDARPDKRAVPDVVKLLASPDPTVRAAAAETLGRIGDPQALSDLEPAMADAEAGVGAAATDACLRLAGAVLVAGDKAQAVTAYRSVLQAAKTEAGVMGALTGLGDCGEVEALGAMRRFLTHDSRRVRVAAIDAIAKLPGEQPTQALSRAVEAAEPLVATTLLHALGRRGDASALAAIRPFAGHADPEVRATALTALGQLGTPAAIPDLKAALTDPDDQISGPAREAYLSLAADLLSSQDADHARAMYEDLVSLADHGPPWVAALAGSVQIASAQSLPILAQTVESATGDDRDRAFAAYAAVCGAMTARGEKGPAATALERALQWVPDPAALQGADLDDTLRHRLVIADGLVAAEAAEQAKGLYRVALTLLPADARLGEVAQKLKALGEPVDVAAVQGFIKDWWVVGPFPNLSSGAWSTRFFPEEGVDLGKEHEVEGARVKWELLATEGTVDFSGHYGRTTRTDQKAAYAYAEVLVDKAQPAIVKMGSDDGIACWLNGRQIHANLVDRGTVIDQDVVTAEVAAGRNTILVKSLNNGGGWSFVLRLCDEGGKPLRFTQDESAGGSGATASAAPPTEAKVRFEKVRLADGASLVETCTAFDVNRDEKLDIVSGGTWYEAPAWTPHRLREVTNDGHYANDWADLALDVNGDGWMDLISGGFHTDDISWYENPQGQADPWPQHLILKRKDFFEAMVMVDLDGDGQGDLLPNDAAPIRWYRLVREAGQEPQWVEQIVGQEGAGHGIGYGDVDLDGHTDIICPTGWYEAPDDARTGQWTWRPEFDLGPTSVPIVALDANGDGLADLIWGEGHSYGLFWLEQKRGEGGQRSWERHVLDSSWSQAHAPELADIDRDGDLDVVVGKRYKAHDTDPGVDDPLCVFWYEFDRTAGKWLRWVVSYNDGAGIGLQQSVVDIDGDGDLDIVSACKTGLHLFVNQGAQ